MYRPNVIVITIEVAWCFTHSLKNNNKGSKLKKEKYPIITIINYEYYKKYQLIIIKDKKYDMNYYLDISCNVTLSE